MKKSRFPWLRNERSVAAENTVRHGGRGCIAEQSRPLASHAAIDEVKTIDPRMIGAEEDPSIFRAIQHGRVSHHTTLTIGLSEADALAQGHQVEVFESDFRPSFESHWQV